MNLFDLRYTTIFICLRVDQALGHPGIAEDNNILCAIPLKSLHVGDGLKRLKALGQV